ncbi:hypothetical protein KF840_05900 [bacterium]|nr:hypothetical protein [bacterium]
MRALYGLPLDDNGLALFRACTGREQPRAGGYPAGAVITGRQSGKTQTAGDVVIYTAATAPADGSADGTYAVLVAQDMRGSMRAAFRYICQAFERVPMLARMVTGRTADALTLANGVTIGVYPCRPAAVRGIRALVAVADELAFYRASDGNPVDVEMLRALTPALATTGGRLLVLSSPYGQAGALWELHRRHFGREDSATLVWQASATTMHDGLPADYLERMRDDDPDAYRSEVLGEFRAGLATLLDPEALDGCVADWREQPPRDGVTYVCGADVSGGQRDATAAAVAYRDGDRVVVAAVRAWPAPHNPETVMGELVDFARRYGCQRITADRYGAQFPQRAAERAGASLIPSELDRSALYLEFLPRVLSGTVTVPHDPVLLRELRGLERKRGFGGKDRVDHRPGAHDDRANAVAMATYLAGGRREGFRGLARLTGF